MEKNNFEEIQYWCIVRQWRETVLGRKKLMQVRAAGDDTARVAVLENQIGLCQFGRACCDFLITAIREQEFKLRYLSLTNAEEMELRGL